jgi:hypothetical protein
MTESIDTPVFFVFTTDIHPDNLYKEMLKNGWFDEPKAEAEAEQTSGAAQSPAPLWTNDAYYSHLKAMPFERYCKAEADPDPEPAPVEANAPIYMNFADFLREHKEYVENSPFAQSMKNEEASEVEQDGYITVRTANHHPNMQQATQNPCSEIPLGGSGVVASIKDELDTEGLVQALTQKPSTGFPPETIRVGHHEVNARLFDRLTEALSATELADVFGVSMTAVANALIDLMEMGK